MRPGFKQFLGMVCLIAFVVVYAFLAMIIGSAMAERTMAVQIAYFAIAGIAWVVPAGLLIKWMAGKPNSKKRSNLQ